MAALTAYLRHGKFSFLHTYLNKLTGFLLFLYPFTLIFSHSAAAIYRICAVATVSGVEELIINFSSHVYDPNQKSFFSKRTE